MFSFCCKEPLESLANDKWECTGCGEIFTEDDLGEYINSKDYPDAEDEG